MTDRAHRQIDLVLAEFGVRVGLDACRLDADDSAQLLIDDVPISIILDEEMQSLLLLTTLGQPEPSVETYGRLLDANLFWAGADGATLSREEGSAAIVMQTRLPLAGLDISLFEAALQGFVDASERMAKLLDGSAPAEDRQPDPPPSQEYFVRG